MGLLGNLNTHEFHDLSNEQVNCQIGEIKKHIALGSIEAAIAAGFDPCDYCLPSTLTACIQHTPAVLERGQAVTLDGRNSRPRFGALKITDWEWTLTPSGGAGDVVSSHEPTFAFILLDDCDVKLKVTNAAGTSHERQKRIACSPREWKPIAWTEPVVGILDEMLDLDGGLYFGRNKCGGAHAHGNDSPGDIIHRSDTAHATWKDSYSTDVVSPRDAGPWRSCWYITEHTLSIQRVEQLGADLQPSSALTP